MKSILILGSTGMLGYGVLSSIIKYKNINVAASIRSKIKLKKIKKSFPYSKINKFHYFDALNVKQDEVKKIINKYDYVINCIGVIKPEIDQNSTKSIKKAIYVNSIFPKILTNSILGKTKIFQIATDCVFSGKKGNYNELSRHDDIEIYGVSKSLGEIKNDNFFNLRTSIIGREFLTKKSLIEWFLSQKDSVRGFQNHDWNGITTKAFGEFIYTIINNEIKVPNIIHVIPKEPVNKYKLLKLFQKKFKSKLKIIKFKTKVKIDRTLSSKNRALINNIWKKTIFKSNPTIEQMIKKLLVNP